MPLEEGETVYTITRHTSKSGMFRVIDAYVIRSGRPLRLLGAVTEEQRAKILQLFKVDRKRDGFRVSGTGMDMGFDLVYSISRVLFGDGYALKQEWM